MATPALSNMSSDLVWEIVRKFCAAFRLPKRGESTVINNLGLLGNNNCFLSKSNRNGGVQFSHDPLNLTNKNSRKVWISGRC
jgi:large subunit ribosomal protein L28e